MLRGKDVVVFAAARSASSWTANEGKPAIRGRTILIFSTSSAPVQPDAVVTNLSVLSTVDAYRMFFAALDLACFAWPTASATSCFGFGTRIILAARHVHALNLCLEPKVAKLVGVPRTRSRDLECNDVGRGD
jgi:hypothetical protein